MYHPLQIKFIPECYADTLMIQLFKVSETSIRHKKGIHKVASEISNFDDARVKLIGLVDDDKKNIPDYFIDFQVLKEEDDLILKHKLNTNHFLIVVNPELEAWLLKSAKMVNINPKDFSLPENPKQLHHITANVNLEDNKNFINFLKAIKKAEAKPFITLENWIKEFFENT
jgi:hypothetical protein